MEETWHPIPFAAPYELSTMGSVRRRVNVKHPERRQYEPIKWHPDKDGYATVRLHGKKWLVHRLAYAVFVGELDHGMVVCHLDGDRQNNQPGNLLQATQKENIHHKKLHGTWQSGEKHPRAKLTNDQAKQINEAVTQAERSRLGRLRRGEALRIAQTINVPAGFVYSISRTRKSYQNELCAWL
jgi:hypothetical protein